MRPDQNITTSQPATLLGVLLLLLLTGLLHLQTAHPALAAPSPCHLNTTTEP